MRGKIVITGGTGSLGQALVCKLFEKFIKIIVFSRDEFKQSQMEEKLSNIPNLRYFLGDVRDEQRLKECFRGADCVIHAAALKQVPKLEYNPTEAIKTNIVGSMNVVNACIDCGVETAVFVSSDKAVNPVNLYGATKLAGEKLFLAANAYNKTKFTVVRYGNVIGSRGSAIPLFQKLAAEGKKKIPITDLNMTRFWITLDEAADLVIYALQNPKPIISVPYIPSMKITDVAQAIIPDCEFECIGIRPGEKLHETLISKQESNVFLLKDGNITCKEEYRSDNNDLWLTKEQLRIKLKL